MGDLIDVAIGASTVYLTLYFFPHAPLLVKGVAMVFCWLTLNALATAIAHAKPEEDDEETGK